MPKASNIVPVSDFRQDAAGILNRLVKSKQPFVITRRGRAAAVLLDIEEYDRSEHERQILHLLASGEAEIAAGKGYGLEDVLAEADEILSRS